MDSDDNEFHSENSEGSESEASSAEDMSEETNTNEEPPSKKMKTDSRFNKSDIYKPPTNDELNQLKETENLFQSSLFRMQIAELLSEVTIKEKKEKQINEYLHKLKNVLCNLPQGKEMQLKDAKMREKKKIQLPFIGKTHEIVGKFTFFAPASVKVVGSYLLGTCIKPDIHVDIAVEMPQAGFQDKDYLNQRYLRKRALYLSFLAHHLKKNELVEEVMFTYHNGNTMKPILEIRPSSGNGKHFKVRIHTFVNEDVFKLNRFHVCKNNVRTKWYSAGQTDTDEKDPATPHYNMAVLHDLTMVSSLEAMHTAMAESPGVKEGVALLKVWLHQRGLDVGYGSFSGFIMTMYVLHLLHKKHLNKLMSSYQIVRNTLIQLSKEDWSPGLSLAVPSVDPHRPSMEEFQSAFEVVFVDPSGYANICSEMTKNKLAQVTHEATVSFEYLQDSKVDGFEVLFMKAVPFLHKFDQVFHISKLDDLDESTSNVQTNKVMDHCGNTLHALLPSIADTLQRALGQRVFLLALKGSPTPKWALKESPPEQSFGKSMTFGILLNPEFSNSFVDKGPAADIPEAKEFREFWGEKSELRRFQDGSICEAVVWPGKTIAARRMVCSKIVRHILNLHFEIPRDAITFIGNQLDSLLTVAQPSKKKTLLYGTGEEQHLDVIKSYDDLCRQIRGLKDLPLSINSIQGTSQVFRYSEVFPALPGTYKRTVSVKDDQELPLQDEPTPSHVQIQKVICILEGSGKWPEDKEAIKRLKAAFNIKLGKLLEEKCSLHVRFSPNYVDVFKDGYVFRVQIGYMREISVLKLTKTPEGMVKSVDTEESLALEQELVVLPKLTSTLHGIQQQNGNYCSTVRLAHRWISSQLLGYELRTEAVDLLVAHIFLHPEPFTAPRSPLVGFLRFLHLLGHHDWKNSPLIVNLNSELNKESVTEISTRFSRDRATLPLMFIATPYDKFTSVWTKKQPNAQVLQRLVLLARESLQILQKQLEDDRIDLDFKQTFRPPLDIYDVVINIDSQGIARKNQAVDIRKDSAISKYTEHQNEERENFPVADFDPVELYFKELKESFDDIALFFYDKFGGNVICVLWKPHAFQPDAFKVSHITCRMPESSGSTVKMVPNVEAIIENFKVIGDGLVKSIDIKTEKSTN